MQGAHTWEWGVRREGAETAVPCRCCPLMRLLCRLCCAASSAPLPTLSRPHLHKVLEAPLARKVGLSPAVEDIHQRDVVACKGGRMTGRGRRVDSASGMQQLWETLMSERDVVA